jgi:DNA invertase Pin-like site-specific DNA recombinase
LTLAISIFTSCWLYSLWVGIHRGLRVFQSARSIAICTSPFPEDINEVTPLARVQLVGHKSKCIKSFIRSFCTVMRPEISSHQKIGYARVSSRDQNLDSQLDLLERAGCTKLFQDKISGVTADRPGWAKLLEYLRPGDTVIVAELSRMSRSLTHLLQIAQHFDSLGVNLISLREDIGTRNATGRFFLSMMGAISQMERELKQERIKDGKNAAKARGKTGGRPKTSMSKLEQAVVLYEKTEKTANEICKALGIGRRTFFYHLASKQKGFEQTVGAANEGASSQDFIPAKL